MSRTGSFDRRSLPPEFVMNDRDCVALLQWALPMLRMRWRGFRKVRRQVCKRVGRRIDELGLSGIEAYRSLLQDDQEERRVLEAMCRITISRFYRDARVFDRLTREVLPGLAGDTLSCWSAGCASGEEAYTLAILWRRGEHARIPLQILGTDIDPHMLERASTGCYPRGSLKELPDELIQKAFVRRDAETDPYCVRKAYRTHVNWMRHDVRERPPEGPFDAVLCRNLVFTYFERDLQEACLERLLSVLRPGGALVVGKHEAPPLHRTLEPWYADDGIYRNG